MTKAGAYCLLSLLLLQSVLSFVPQAVQSRITRTDVVVYNGRGNDNAQFDSLNQEEKFGGYTVKQRLREEIESPFRKVRLYFFGFTTASASISLYFSFLSTVKAMAGGFPDAPPLEEALTNDAINLVGAVVSAYLVYRDYNIGLANLERIARGGKLANLAVAPASSEGNSRVRLTDYRRKSRVLICAGGENYIRKLALSLTADQLADSNTLPEKLEETDMIVVPVLLSANDPKLVADTASFWKSIETDDPEKDRNFDINRANSVIAFPRGNPSWSEYLEPEIETAVAQGFDVSEKGITLTVKKNGRILRRATGLPPFGDLISTMEVADGSRFGMPGDSERYGGP